MPRDSVFIVDDDPAIRDSLALMIEQEGLAVEAFDSAEAFLSAAPQACHGCIIIDVRMPGMDGLELQKMLSELKIDLPVIFLTGHGDIPMSVRAIKAGATDFLTKPVTAEKLLASVRTALREGQRRQEQAAVSQKALECIAHLTEREKEVMELAVLGYPNKEIARRLDISHRTVEIHKSKIMSKTGAMNLLDLARIAGQSKLIKS